MVDQLVTLADAATIDARFRQRFENPGLIQNGSASLVHFADREVTVGKFQEFLSRVITVMSASIDTGDDEFLRNRASLREIAPVIASILVKDPSDIDKVFVG